MKKFMQHFPLQKSGSMLLENLYQGKSFFPHCIDFTGIFSFFFQGSDFGASKGKPRTSFNTVMLKRRKSNGKSVELQVKQKSLERQIEPRTSHVCSKSPNRYLEKEPSLDKVILCVLEKCVKSIQS